MFGQDTAVNPLAAGLMRYSSGMPFAVSGPAGPAGVDPGMAPAGGGVGLGQGVTENGIAPPVNFGAPVGAPVVAPVGGPAPPAGPMPPAGPPAAPGPIPGTMNTPGRPMPPVPLPPVLANPMGANASQAGNHQGQFGNQGFGFGMNSAGQMY